MADVLLQLDREDLRRIRALCSCAARDYARPTLNNVYLDAECMVATDSWVLGHLPIGLPLPDPVQLPASWLRYACAPPPRGMPSISMEVHHGKLRVIRAGTVMDVTLWPRNGPDEGTSSGRFPEWRSLVPRRDHRQTSWPLPTYFDERHLGQVMALVRRDVGEPVRLWAEGPFQPVVVEQRRVVTEPEEVTIPRAPLSERPAAKQTEYHDLLGLVMPMRVS